MSLPNPRPLISFDWAIKRLLRQKANYGILEGFLSELLRQEVIIISIPESESNRDVEDDKANKVDIICENNKGELFLIELQYYSEWDFLHRMLFGSSKLIADYLKTGAAYGSVKKVYSINIVYFELGQGTDYVYHGKTEFRGLHGNDILQVNAGQKAKLQKEAIYQIFPEYYILKVNTFNNVAKDALDEWIYYFKNNALPETITAKGLDKVATQLKIDNMTTQERINYESHLKNLAISHSMLETAQLEGEEKKARSTAAKLINRGYKNEDIADLTGLSEQTIDELRKTLMS